MVLARDERVRGQAVTDSEGLLRMALNMFLPERFDRLLQPLSAEVSPEEWREVIARIPELSL